MKSTIKTSRTAGQLEKMFRELNKHYYNGELPEPIITLKKTPSLWSHHHGQNLDGQHRTGHRAAV